MDGEVRHTSSPVKEKKMSKIDKKIPTYVGTISWAVRHMKDGHKVRRAGWSNTNKYLSLEKIGDSGDTTFVMRSGSDGDLHSLPWSMGVKKDIMAEDWEVKYDEQDDEERYKWIMCEIKSAYRASVALKAVLIERGFWYPGPPSSWTSEEKEKMKKKEKRRPFSFQVYLPPNISPDMATKALKMEDTFYWEGGIKVGSGEYHMSLTPEAIFCRKGIATEHEGTIIVRCDEE